MSAGGSGERGHHDVSKLQYYLRGVAFSVPKPPDPV
jgi:hypothetical protein